jgi:threonine synthase
MIDQVLNFDIPVVPIHDNIYSLELFHGPTLAFKDVGARFMARLMSYYAEGNSMKVIAATSGDTGAPLQQVSTMYQELMYIFCTQKVK